MHWLCLTSRALCMHSPAFPVTPVDTTGAGDLFASGFLHAYLEGYSLEQCARLGALAGAAVVGTMGAELPAKEMAALKEKINHRAFTCPDQPTSPASSSIVPARVGRPKHSIELGSGAIAIPGRNHFCGREERLGGM
mgnify:FL=1